MSVKETILLIHGTYAAPDLVHFPQWYQPESSFISRLHAELQLLKSPAKCWAHCAPDAGGHKMFSWSGENHWRDRAEASKHLAGILDELVRDGWRCHIVAHSHGGNVVLDALRKMRALSSPGYADAWASGSIVTMGTPFIEFDDSVSFRSRRKLWVGWLISILCLTGLLIAFVQYGIGSWRHIIRSLESTPWYVFPLAVYLVVCIGFLILILRALANHQIGAYDPPRANQLLVMTTPEDEAWQLLDGLQSNRFKERLVGAPKDPWFKSRKEWLQQTVRLALDADAVAFPSRSIWFDLAVWIGIPALLLPSLAVEGLPSTLKVVGGVYAIIVISTMIGHWGMGRASLLAPIRILSIVLFVLGAEIRSIAFRFGGSQVWNWATAFATGLSDFPLPMPRISQNPSGVDTGFYQRYEVDSSLVAQAVLRRGESFGVGANELIAAVGDPKLTRSEFESKLKQITQNTTLCHAIYYTEATCVTRIARWIAGSDSEMGAD